MSLFPRRFLCSAIDSGIDIKIKFLLAREWWRYMKIVMLNGQNHKGSTYHIGRQIIDQRK